MRLAEGAWHHLHFQTPELIIVETHIRPTQELQYTLAEAGKHHNPTRVGRDMEFSEDFRFFDWLGLFCQCRGRIETSSYTK